MKELIEQIKDRQSIPRNTYKDVIEGLVTISRRWNKRRNSFIPKSYIRNKDFLLDESIKSNNLIDSVIHIIQTYGGHRHSGYLPYSVVEHYKNVLKQIMLDFIKDHITEFQGHLSLLSSECESESERQAVEFGMAFYDPSEIEDLCTICIPHL